MMEKTDIVVFENWHNFCDFAQELLRLPAVSAEVVAGFEAAMMGTRSEKDQRNLIRRLLFNSGTPLR